MKRLLSLLLALLALCDLAHGQAVNTLSISNSFAGSNFFLVSIGNKMRRIPSTNVFDQISSNGFSDSVLLPSSDLTNYTITASQNESTLNMTNAVRFTLLSGGTTGRKSFPCVTLTNFTASTQTLDFTNTWKCYGATTNTVPAGMTARVCFEVEGANVRYAVAIQGDSGAVATTKTAIYLGSTSTGVTAGNAYYFGGNVSQGFDSALSGVSGNLRTIRAPRAGTIREMWVQLQSTAATAFGSADSFSVRLTNVTAGTSALVSTLSVSNQIRAFYNSNLGLAVASNDVISGMVVMPATFTNAPGSGWQAIGGLTLE